MTAEDKLIEALEEIAALKPVGASVARAIARSALEAHRRSPSPPKGGARIGRLAGEQLEQTHPWGYRSEDKEP